jgi:hypothetical protein
MGQRTAKRKYEAGLKTAMTDVKLQHLSDMDFQWSVKKEQNDATWDQRLKELKQYKDEHGHCRVPQRRSGKLGKWVKMQRKSKVSALRSRERTASFDEIGFFD